MRVTHALTILAVALTACGRADHGAAVVHVDTLPNGAIHVRSEGAQWAPGAGWRAVPDLTLGGDDAGEIDLTDIRGLAVDAQDRIYLLDNQNAAIHVFDATGRRVRTIGRRGGGPGEFNQPIGIAIHGARLIAVDQGNVRITEFDTSGAVMATHPRSYANIGVGLWAGGLDSAGGVVDQIPQRGDGVGAPTHWFLSPLDPHDFTPVDSFPLPSFTPKAIVKQVQQHGGINRTVMNVPFTPTLSWVFDGRGYIWFGVGDRFQVIQRRLGGDTVRIIERTWVPDPIPDTTRSRLVERMQQSLGEGFTGSLSDLPTTRPAFGALVVDDTGNLWVGAYGWKARRWDVFDPEGRWLGPVEFPAPIRGLLFARGRYYGFDSDSLDVVHLVRGHLARP